jgi:hypothetical protein
MLDLAMDIDSAYVKTLVRRRNLGLCPLQWNNNHVHIDLSSVRRDHLAATQAHCELHTRGTHGELRTHGAHVELHAY